MYKGYDYSLDEVIDAPTIIEKEGYNEKLQEHLPAITKEKNVPDSPNSSANEETKTRFFPVADLKSMLYELYKLDWKASHNITPERETMILKDYLNLYPPECYTKANPPEQSFEQFLEEMGYQGELYVCYDEFLECEYKDVRYVKFLLEGMDSHYFKDYEDNLYLSLQEERE